MRVEAIKTDIFRKADNLVDFVIKYVGESIEENSIVLITSKIVSLAENRLLKNIGQDKEQLVRQEADQFLGRLAHDCFLTIKEALLIPTSGIDESNSESGDYILFPEAPYKSAKDLHHELTKKLNIKNLGVIITDSHTTPLRRGVLGVALSYWGFNGLHNQIDEEDLFGRKLKMTQQNVVDALAVSGVLLMGEGAESKPLALIKQAPVEFGDAERKGEVSIAYAEDLYYPIYKHLLE